ncbi:MAG: hypothetical protein HYV63_24905 [Candidatus Schekmanbacteria bacterium]|nr:hypothetical protein [Candidatus Schekmanbacteria bacterium]
MTPHRPEVKIAATAFARMCAELDRVCPREAVLVPAIALTMRNPDRNPCAMIKLQDLAEILVARVVLMPPDRQINRAAAVCVRAATDEIVGLEVQDLLDRYPRLRACGYIHSHPFAQGSTWPSSGPGGDIEGHMLPLLARNRACNLDLSLSLIACRDPVAPGWKLQAFALASEVGPVLDLGFAAREQGAGERAALARSLMPPHESRPDAARVLRRLRTGLRDRGATYEEDALFDGWIRIVTTHPRQARAVLLIPPDFPRSGARVYLGGSAAGSTRAAPLEPRGATDPEALLRVLAPAPPPPGKGASPAAQDYFSRVQPVIGLGLSDKTVRIENLSACARVVELLAGCGVARFVAPATARPATWPLDRDRWAFPAADNGGGGGGTEREAIQSHLAWKNGFLPVACLPGGLADAGVAGELLSPGASAYVDWDGSRRRVTFGVPHGDLLGWENASYHVGGRRRRAARCRRHSPRPYLQPGA